MTIGGTYLTKACSSLPQFKHAVISIVLSTDMAQHFDLVARFTTKVGVLDPRQEDYRATLDDNMPLIMSMAIKAADIGHCASRWPAHQFWSKCLEQEFFAQGDRERAAGLPVSPMMNRRGTSKAALYSLILTHNAMWLSIFSNSVYTSCWVIIRCRGSANFFDLSLVCRTALWHPMVPAGCCDDYYFLRCRGTGSTCTVSLWTECFRSREMKTLP
jgi:hypothetical protein